MLLLIICAIIRTKEAVCFSLMKEGFILKRLFFLMCLFVSLHVWNITSFAETRTIDIDGESVVVETFGNAQFYDGEIEEERAMTRSVSEFSFNINDYVQTDYIENTHRKWRVQTQAYLRNYRTREADMSGNTKYIVAIRDSSGKKIFSYVGKTDNVYGGVTFSKVPKKRLCISVSKKKTGEYFLFGKGDTAFLD